MQLHQLRALLALATAAFWLAGCQSYEPRPLNLEEHREAWLDRSPTSEPVTAFAQRLEEGQDVPPVFDPSDGITVAEAEVIALVFNADLRLARARAGILSATAEHAGLWEDPIFTLDFMKITESVSNPWVITPALLFTIPLSGRLEVEKDRADAAVVAQLYTIAEQEWATRATVRLAWLDWSAARLRLEETIDIEQRLVSIAESTRLLAEAGELPRTEAALFAIELARRRNEMIRLQLEAREQELIIRSLLGLAPEAPLELVPSVAVKATTIPPSAEALDNNLTLARLRQEYEVAEQTLHREILKQYPDLTIGPAYETDNGQSRVGFFGAIPIPILNANKQAIAEARASRELARATFETEFERQAGRLARRQTLATAIQTQRADIESVLIPLVDRQLVDARQLLAIGESGSLVMLESLVRAYETKLTLIELRRDESAAWVEIDRILGPESSANPPNVDNESPS